MPWMDSRELERQIAALDNELSELTSRRAALMQRLSSLRQREISADGGRDDGSSASAEWDRIRKIELFRSLFRGRDEVFAVRWERTCRYV